VHEDRYRWRQPGDSRRRALNGSGSLSQSKGGNESTHLPAWDDLYEQTGAACPYNNSHFLNRLEDVYRCINRSAVIKGSNGPLGVPAFEVRTPLSGHKVTTAPFGFYPTILGDQDHRRALDYLTDLAAGLGRRAYVEYKVIGALPEACLARHNINVTTPTLAHVLPLEDSYKVLKRGFAKRHRESLQTIDKRVRKDGVEIVATRVETDVRAWFRLLVRLYRDKHLMVTQPWPLFRRLCMDEDMSPLAELMIARKQGHVVAGVVVLKGRHEWVYAWSAQDPVAEKDGLVKYILDQSLQKAISFGAKRFSFGLTPPSHKGLRDFKMKWGCHEEPVYHLYWNARPKNVDLQMSARRLRMAYRFVPLWLAERLPSFIVPRLA